MNTLKTFGERLKFARKRFGTQGDLSEATGISQNAISNYETGKRTPSIERGNAISTVLGVSQEWLNKGIGSMEITPPPESTNDNNEKIEPDIFPVIYEAKPKEDLINIPLVAARLSAGVGSLLVDSEVERYFAFSSAFLRRKGNPATMVMMKVDGDSMSPEIRDGDMVLIDQSKIDIRLGRIFAVGFGEAIYLKRIDTEPGKLLLKSVNPAYKPVEILTESQEVDSFRVVGQVLWVGREY